MSPIRPLYPRQPVPALRVPTVAGGDWDISAQAPEHFTLVVLYRGFHCPICASYLKQLHGLLSDFADRGVEVVAISSDGEDRATRSRDEWEIPQLTIGYDLDLGKAREWGLFLSRGHGKTSAGVEEPALFSEPALYLVRPDGTLYFGAVQTMPFARPDFKTVLGALDFVLKADYPARGEVQDD